MAIFYYYGLMQAAIGSLSKFMRWTMGTGGAETMACAANTFVGQTEAPLFIRPYVKDLTNSELHTVMLGGFATVAAGVIPGYVALGIRAEYLIAACLMAAPASLMVGKIILPETGHPRDFGNIKLEKENRVDNLLQAISNGILTGLKLAVNVGAMLIGFIALIALLDILLCSLDFLIDGKLLGAPYRKYLNAGLSPVNGEYSGFFPGSMKTFFGTILRPLVWLMGVSWHDSGNVGNLVGVKLSVNEFVAYGDLAVSIRENTLDEKSATIATYALCGFANFTSIGIQAGGIAAIAPDRKADFARLALKAMFGGAIVSCISAAIAGLLY